MAFDLDPNYKQVPERIADLKKAHPEARLRPTNPDKPYWLESVEMSDSEGNLFTKTFIVYSASCYRDSTDQLPGIGIAWEPFPGTTPYTRNSELQNAETSAWGRAIIATLASESKTIASAEDVRNRAAEGEAQSDYRPASGARIIEPSQAQLNAIHALRKKNGMTEEELLAVAAVTSLAELTGGRNGSASALITGLQDMLASPDDPTRNF